MTSLNYVASASNRSRRATSGSPTADPRAARAKQDHRADERLADAEAELERLARLERADDPRQDAEHATFGAARRELRRRRLREEAAVAGALVRLEHRGLPLEAVDRAVDERDVVP